MKKILSLFILSLTFSPMLKAQDAQKNLRFGIRLAPGLSWMSPENDKKIKKDGISMKAAIGLVTEFRITDVASFSTGLDYMTAGGKTSYLGSDTAGYLYKDDAIVETTTENGDIKTPDPLTIDAAHGYKSYLLEKRNYKIGYVHIPLTFKLKTKDIGGMTYFGQIGGDIFIRTSGKADDEVRAFNYTTFKYDASEDLKKIDIANQINLINFGVNVGGGLEYNLSGTTAAFASIHYVHSLLNTTKSDSKYLLRSKYDVTQADHVNTGYFPNALKNRQIVLSLGILF